MITNLKSFICFLVFFYEHLLCTHYTLRKSCCSSDQFTHVLYLRTTSGSQVHYTNCGVSRPSLQCYWCLAAVSATFQLRWNSFRIICIYIYYFNLLFVINALICSHDVDALCRCVHSSVSLTRGGIIA